MEAKRLVELFDIARKAENINEVSVDPNANTASQRSVYGLLQNCKKELDREAGFLLLEREMEKIVGKDEAQRLITKIKDYGLYLHDSTHIPLVYCASFNLGRFWQEQNKFGKLVSEPVKRLDSYIAEVGDFLDQSCLHLAGAVGLASLFIDMAYILARKQTDITLELLKSDNQTRSYVRNLFQQLRYTGSHNSRGDECAFWNVSLIDIEQMREFFKQEDDCELLIQLCWELQVIFLEEHNDANTDPKKPRSPFPIVTANCQDPSQSRLINWMSRNTNFFNYNYFFSETVKFAMCCRFVLDSELVEDYGGYGNSFAASPFAISCHRVVTINLPRIANESSTLKGFELGIRQAARECAIILKGHKNLIQSFADEGVYPLINDGWVNMNRMLSAIGIIGMPEMQWIASRRIGEGVDYMKLALDVLSAEGERLSEEYKLSLVVEQIPGESASNKLAIADKERFGEDEQPFTYYSNQFLPLWEPTSFWEKTECEGKYQNLCSGGGISLLRLSSEVKSPTQAVTLLQYAYDVGCHHVAPTATYSHCKNGCVTHGKHSRCPQCGGEIEDYSEKVCGYIQETKNWEPYKKLHDFKTRVGVTL